MSDCAHVFNASLVCRKCRRKWGDILTADRLAVEEACRERDLARARQEFDVPGLIKPSRRSDELAKRQLADIDRLAEIGRLKQLETLQGACSHVFRDSVRCVKCGVSAEVLRSLEAMEARGYGMVPPNTAVTIGGEVLPDRPSNEEQNRAIGVARFIARVWQGFRNADVTIGPGEPRGRAFALTNTNGVTVKFDMTELAQASYNSPEFARVVKQRIFAAERAAADADKERAQRAMTAQVPRVRGAGVIEIVIATLEAAIGQPVQQVEPEGYGCVLVLPKKARLRFTSQELAECAADDDDFRRLFLQKLEVTKLGGPATFAICKRELEFRLKLRAEQPWGPQYTQAQTVAWSPRQIALAEDMASLVPPAVSLKEAFAGEAEFVGTWGAAVRSEDPQFRAGRQSGARQQTPAAKVTNGPRRYFDE